MRGLLATFSVYIRILSYNGEASLPENEAKWLLAARNGNSEAFSRLVDMYSRPVYSLCYRMLGNPQDAEDAAQEAFLRAFRYLHRYDANRKFATWLLSIAANHCIDQHRRVRPVQVALEDASPVDLRDRRIGPEGRALAREASDRLQVLLNELAPKDRAAMLLYYWYEYSLAEIARELRLSEPALKARMHRARRSLAQAWLHSGEAPAFSPRRLYEEAAP